MHGSAVRAVREPPLRPFNAEELRRILRVGLCLPCHASYNDPACKDYDAKRACPKYQEP